MHTNHIPIGFDEDTTFSASVLDTIEGLAVGDVALDSADSIASDLGGVAVEEAQAREGSVDDVPVVVVALDETRGTHQRDRNSEAIDSLKVSLDIES